MALELQSAMFQKRGHGETLSRDPCPDCDQIIGDREECHDSYALSEAGYETLPDRIDALVSWPKCPWMYANLRRYGQRIMRIDGILEWMIEQGIHRDPDIPASAEYLLSTYFERREWPETMLLRKRQDSEKKK